MQTKYSIGIQVINKKIKVDRLPGGVPVVFLKGGVQ